MVLLSVAIIIALLITIGLPIVAGIWLNKKLNLTWRVITLGALGYFVVQALVTLLISGLAGLVDNGVLVLSNHAFIVVQLTMSILFGALLGVIVRWAAMKYYRESLSGLNAALGIGLGYGGVESIIRVGLPLLMTYITMLSNIRIDPQTTQLTPELIAQIEALWQVSAWVPLAGSLERIAALVMHITVTMLIWQSFLRKNNLWLGAAVGLDMLINGSIVGLAEAGLAYGWVVLLAVLFMAGNLFLLYRLKVFEPYNDKPQINVSG